MLHDSLGVRAIAICDFEIWPDAEQKKQNLPLVPMLSRWNMREHGSGDHGLMQVQYAFLELPKLPEQRPEAPGAALWAWLFVHAPELTEMPADLSPGPYRAALELANKATFTREELDAYQKVIDEIQQVRELAEAKWAEGKAAGLAEGLKSGIAEGLESGKVAARPLSKMSSPPRRDLHEDPPRRAGPAGGGEGSGGHGPRDVLAPRRAPAAPPGARRREGAPEMMHLRCNISLGG